MFGKRYTEPISMPIEMQFFGNDSYLFPVLMSIILGLNVLAVIAASIDDHRFSPEDATTLLGFGLLGLMCWASFANIAAHRRLGPGTLTVSASGFRDTRLVDEWLPWSAFHSATRWTGSRGRTRGVKLDIRPEAAPPRLNPDYALAYGGEPLRINLELFYFARAPDLADYIIACVQAGGPPERGAYNRGT